MEVPCGQCIGCRIARSREWAMRCMHEASLHVHNQFVTLTYSDERLPQRGTLVPRDLTLFLKRLRKAYEGRISYFACGEYGDTTGRAHYHALLFGLALPDAKLWSERKDQRLYTSEWLSSIWGQGHVVIGPVTYETAAYCARYSLKKVNGRQAETHYRRVDPETGEVFHVEPEFIRMSTRPAIGRGWFDKYQSDLYPSDEAIHKGKRLPVPKYYDRLFGKQNPTALAALKDARVKRANTVARKIEQTPHRRAIRAEVTRLKLDHFKRKL